VTNLAMPTHDGMDVLHVLRDQAYTGDVIVMSGRDGHILDSVAMRPTGSSRHGEPVRDFRRVETGIGATERTYDSRRNGVRQHSRLQK
jgi:hypothetical protein